MHLPSLALWFPYRCMQMTSFSFQLLLLDYWRQLDALLCFYEQRQLTV